MPVREHYSHPSALFAVTGELTYQGKSWSRTAGYRTMARADLPINPFNHSSASWKQNLWDGYRTIDNGSGFLTVVASPQYAYYASTIKGFHDSCYSSSGASDRITALLNAAVIKALGKVADAKTNVGVMLAEARKTSDMILDTAKRVFGAMQALRARNYGQVARLLDLNPRTVHKNWLAYKYGWTPLLMDVKSAAELFAQQIEIGRAHKFTVLAKEEDTVRFHRVVNDGSVGGTPYNREEWFATKLAARVTLWLRLDSLGLATAQQIGLTNPALYAWEVLPYSFVFDWFISVGDYLTAVSALSGVPVEKAMYDIVDASSYTGAYPNTVGNDGVKTHYCGERVLEVSRRNYIRAVPTLDVSQLSPPIVRNKDGELPFQKLVTGLALLRGASGGLPKGWRP